MPADSYTRANNADINMGAPFSYTTISDAAQIATNRLHPANVGAGLIARVRADIDVSAADMWAQVTVALLNFGTSVELTYGLMVRYSPSADTHYYAIVDGTTTSATVFLGKEIATVGTDLASVGITVAQGDVLRLEVKSDTMTFFLNGVSKLSVAGGSAVTTGTRAGALVSRTNTTGGADLGFTNLIFDDFILKAQPHQHPVPMQRASFR